MKPILLSFFLLFSFSVFSTENEVPAHTLLDRALAEGNIHAFRIETRKLLNDPVPDFFKSIVAYMGNGFHLKKRLKGIAVARSSSSAEAITQLMRQVAFDNFILKIALSLPLGKKNKNDLTARNIALLSENWPVRAVLEEYDNNFTFGLHDGETTNVWDASSRQLSIDTNLEDIPWKQLPRVNLLDVPLVRVLFEGDMAAFQKSWKTLLAGPAWELFTLLHSRGENGETFFHHAAAFRPKHLQDIDNEDLTSKQKRELHEAQEMVASNLKELLKLFPPSKGFDEFFDEEGKGEQEEALTLLSNWNKRKYAVIGASGVIVALTAVSSKDELIAVLAGVASGLAIEGTLRCYDKFKSKSTSKSGNR